jgi:hypothetical protein
MAKRRASVKNLGKIVIGGITYEVEGQDLLRNEDTGDYLYGAICYHENKLRLMTGMGSQHQMVTLWHEILHALLAHAGHEEHPEDLLDLMAFGIVGVLQANEGNPLLQLSPKEQPQ